MQTRESFDDFGGFSEVAAEPEGLRTAAAPPADPPLVAARAVEPAPARVAQPEGEDEENGAREPLVPRGTFTSELPDRANERDDREQPRAEGPGKSPKPPAPALSGSQRIKVARNAARPPYLASEILREDLTPAEPGGRLLQVVLHVAPASGVVAASWSGLDRGATWLAFAVLAGLFALTRVELIYSLRALLVSLVGGGALAAITLWRMALGGVFEGPLLAAAATLLPAALLFRAWYRGAAAARALVALALVLALAWAAATGRRDLLALEFDWQSWVPALTWYVFGILCLLSLLAFMGDETTGGCDAWAIGILFWYGGYACVRFALENAAAGSLHGGNLQTLGLVEPALAAPVSIALAQLFARAFGARSRRANGS